MLRSGPRSGSQRGSVSVLLATVMLLAALIGLGLARLGAAEARAASAQAAADAAALAGAADGRRAATTVAEANQARLISFVQDGLDAEVVVVRAGHRAVARARWQPGYTDIPPG